MEAREGMVRWEPRRVLECSGVTSQERSESDELPLLLWERTLIVPRSSYSNLSERLPGPAQTNNRAEMYASRLSSTFRNHVAKPSLTPASPAGRRSHLGNGSDS